MNVFFRRDEVSKSSLRARLLRDSLRTHLQKNAQSLSASFHEIEDGEQSLSALEALGVLPCAKSSELSVFVGLANAPERMLGRNILVCTRPLTEELEDFALRNAGKMNGSVNWSKNVLDNFERVVLLSRGDFIKSAGFSRWVRVLLSDRFPILLEGVGRRDDVRVLILQHDLQNGAKVVGDIFSALSPLCNVRVVADAVDASEAKVEILNSDIHVHVGYYNLGRSIAITPFDSIAAGYYTLIVPSSSQSRAELGQALLHEAGLRTYVEVADTIDDAVASCSGMVGRLETMRKHGFHMNPEVGRFSSINENYNMACLKRFEECLK